MFTPNQIEGINNPPYFARLNDARNTLGPTVHHRRPDLHSERAFVVVNHFLDELRYGPGLWLQAAAAEPHLPPIIVPATACELMAVFSSN